MRGVLRHSVLFCICCYWSDCWNVKRMSWHISALLKTVFYIKDYVLHCLHTCTIDLHYRGYITLWYGVFLIVLFSFFHSMIRWKINVDARCLLVLNFQVLSGAMDCEPDVNPKADKGYPLSIWKLRKMVCFL